MGQELGQGGCRSSSRSSLAGQLVEGWRRPWSIFGGLPSASSLRRTFSVSTPGKPPSFQSLCAGLQPPLPSRPGVPLHCLAPPLLAGQRSGASMAKAADVSAGPFQSLQEAVGRSRPHSCLPLLGAPLAATPGWSRQVEALGPGQWYWLWPSSSRPSWNWSESSSLAKPLTLLSSSPSSGSLFMVP